MRLIRSAVSLSAIIAMTACAEQGSSPFASTSPSRVESTQTTPATGARNMNADAINAPASIRSASTATVQFGQPNVGTVYPPAFEHDRSAHAKDNMVPRNVVIDRGGTVTFKTFGVHEVAIYEDGTDPDDIDTSKVTAMPAGCPTGNAPLLMTDADNRIALYTQPCGGERQVVHTFTQPGKYLVICAFLPHFQVQMYGWVTVR
jgi:plastocyanin